MLFFTYRVREIEKGDWIFTKYPLCPLLLCVGLLHDRYYKVTTDTTKQLNAWIEPLCALYSLLLCVKPYHNNKIPSLLTACLVTCALSLM
jgi:hypothetical protein